MARSITTFVHDCRFCLRTLAKTPGVTAGAVLSLALAIGGNAAVFTLVEALIIRMLPVSAPSELVFMETSRLGRPDRLSYPMARDLLANQPWFTSWGFISGHGMARARFGEHVVDRAVFSIVSHEYFPLLGLKPAAGRFFTLEEDRAPGMFRKSEVAAVISYKLWDGQFARDPSIIGRRFIFDAAPCSVIGVAAEGFNGHIVGTAIDIFLPMTPVQGHNDLTDRNRSPAEVMTRLAPGISLTDAQRQATAAFRRLLKDEPGRGGPGVRDGAQLADYSIQLRSASYGLGPMHDRYATPLIVCMTGVALVLLIACANIANLLLARGLSRSQELAVRPLLVLRVGGS